MDIPSSSRTPLPTHKAQKSSFSSSISWITRSSLSPTEKYSAGSSFKHMMSISKPSSLLGSGVTIVKTPQEALAGSGLNRASLDDEQGSHFLQVVEDESSPESPLLSPPAIADPASPFSYNIPHTRSMTPTKPRISTRPHAPTKSYVPAKPVRRAPPSPSCLPSSSSPRPVAKVQTPYPMFDPLLLSPVPIAVSDYSKVIVTLDTATESYRTTLKTIMARPSCLSMYFTSLLESAISPRRLDPEECSIYSQQSDDESDPVDPVVHNGPISSVPLSAPTASFLHIFLDRPSAPYLHILAYLRSIAPDKDAVLPRPVQLISNTSPARMEAMLELRDEAEYLHLEELHELCLEELSYHRQRHSASGHAHSSGHAHLVGQAPGVGNISASNHSGKRSTGAASSHKSYQNGTKQHSSARSPSRSSLHRIPTPSSSVTSLRLTPERRHSPRIPHAHDIHQESNVPHEMGPGNWI